MRPLNQIYFPKTLRLGMVGVQTGSAFATYSILYPQFIALTAVIVVAGLAFLAGRGHLETSGRLLKLTELPR